LKEIEERPESDPQGQSILEMVLRSGGKPVAVSMAMDALMAGIDTTSNSTAIALYYLSTNEDAQQKVFEEVSKIVPNKTDHLPENYLNSIPYLKACIKESQR